MHLRGMRFRWEPMSGASLSNERKPMSDRIKGLTVTLEADYRDDNAAPVIEAIRLLRGVIDVVPEVADAHHYMAVVQARNILRKKLWDALESET